MAQSGSEWHAPRDGCGSSARVISSARYRSTNGTTWSLVGSDTISMASTVYVGLAVTSHNPGARATATFTNVTARKLTTGTNQPPTVSITGPAAGATFTAGANITVDGDGERHRWHDCEGRVLPWLDADGVGRDHPYGATWTNAPAGTYQLTAVATDSDGDTTTSAPVSVTVNSPTNQAPTVSLTSPAAGSTFTAPANITVAATASDSDGTVTRVDFYRGSTMIGSDTSSPYGYTWTNAAAGSYQLTAVARDDDGATRTSAVANITVSTVPNQLPTVSISVSDCRTVLHRAGLADGQGRGQRYRRHHCPGGLLRRVAAHCERHEQPLRGGVEQCRCWQLLADGRGSR